MEYVVQYFSPEVYAWNYSSGQHLDCLGPENLINMLLTTEKYILLP